MLRSVARRWPAVRESFRPFLRCRIVLLLAASGSASGFVWSTKKRRPSSPSSSFIPKRRPCSSRKSEISFSDFLPKFSIPSISSSDRCTRSPSVRMFSFWSEFRERTDSSARSSIGRSKRSCRRSGTATAPGGATSGIPPSPKYSMYSRCFRTSSAAYATASSGVERTVGLDLQREAVEVGALADAGLFDREVRPTHRVVDRVDPHQIHRRTRAAACAGRRGRSPGPCSHAARR